MKWKLKLTLKSKLQTGSVCTRVLKWVSRREGGGHKDPPVTPHRACPLSSLMQGQRNATSGWLSPSQSWVTKLTSWLSSSLHPVPCPDLKLFFLHHCVDNLVTTAPQVSRNDSPGFWQTANYRSLLSHSHFQCWKQLKLAYRTVGQHRTPGNRLTALWVPRTRHFWRAACFL